MSLTDFSTRFGGHPLVEDRFISLPEVLTTTGVKAKSIIYRMIGEKEFPSPYAITKSRRAWSMNEIQAWIASRKRAA